jgi:CheY-like chemotaxis protein/HPt (histidine-containing phosphotransfer) domain-containing protein
MRCEQVRHYLEDWGMRIEWVPTGIAALEYAARATRVDIDVLLIDERLMDMSGSDVAATLREQGLVRPERVILMLPFGAAAPQGGAVACASISAPLRRQELLRTVAVVLGAAHAQPICAITPPANDATEVHGSVLLVDDNPVNQEVFVGMLNDLGCRVDVAADGLTAVEMVGGGAYDVILMDYHLPGIDGLEATRRIRGLGGKHRSTPIVALTANAAPSDRAHCLNAGMDDFLSKPCSTEMLARVLRQWIAVRAVPDGSDHAVSRVEFDPQALDRIRNIRRADGSSILPKTLALFLRTSDESLVDIEAALADEDADRIRFTAHRLKSGCANLGALSMARICRDVEELGREGKTRAVQQLLPGLREQHQLTVAWLQEQVDGRA